MHRSGGFVPFIWKNAWTRVVHLPGTIAFAACRKLDLPHCTSLLDLRAALPEPADREEKERLRIFSLESALIACSPTYFSNNAADARAVVAMVRDASGLLARLVAGGHSVIAGRLPDATRTFRSPERASAGDCFGIW